MYLQQESYDIIGACMEVHNVLGIGFVEKVYQDALEVELMKRGIPYEREKVLNITYKGIQLQHVFKPDFICYDKIILELKSERELTDVDRAQILNYLNASHYKLGWLINFGQTSLVRERYVM